MGKYLKKFDTHSEYQTYINGQDAILPNVSYCVNNNDVHYNPYFPPIVAKFNVTDTSSATSLYFYYAEEGYEEFWKRAVDSFSKIEIDGVDVSPSDLDADEGKYLFTTTGEHIVKYSLIDETSIGNGAFVSCTGLTNITIPDSVTTIGGAAFQSCTGLTNITLPNNITSIDSTIFYGCTGLTSIIIPDSVTTIGNSAFVDCSSLTSIIIPNSVTTIDGYAFSDCTGLTSVTIGNSVTNIGNSAFLRCTGLTSVTSLATTAPTISNNTFQNVKTGGTLYVPTGSDYSVWMGTGNYYLGKYSWTKVEQ